MRAAMEALEQMGSPWYTTGSEALAADDHYLDTWAARLGLSDLLHAVRGSGRAT